jgi:DNA-binding helix-hairpin-helix protein with protein kinase domain
MGEEQDKFALAVILFKLLNNGIHPFSFFPL